MASVIEGEMQSCTAIVDEVRQIKKELVGVGHDEREVSQMRFWYRGHAREDWSLVPSGLRPPFDQDPERLQTMLHEFRAEATVIHETPPSHDDARQWLFLMRHYEMPTLLIDWTRSPLTALYFAVNGPRETADQDGVLWMVRPGVWNRFAVPKSCEGGRDRLLEAYASELDGLFKVHFDKRSLQNEEEAARWIAAIEPVYNSRRMIVQQSVFTIHGPCSQPMEILHESFAGPCLWRWRIPGDKKQGLRQELHDLGIQRSALFPDLDNLSRCIKARYEASFMSTTLLEGKKTEGPSTERGSPPALSNTAPGLEGKKTEETRTERGSPSALSDISPGFEDNEGGQTTGSSYVR